MGMNYQVYVGPLIKVQLKKVSKIENVKKCPGCRKENIRSLFCPDCGKEIIEVEVDKIEFETTYDLLSMGIPDNDRVPEDLCDSDLDDKGACVFFSNYYEEQLDTEENFAVINQQVINDLTDSFLKTNKEFIQKLKDNNYEYEILFGFHSYYS